MTTKKPKPTPLTLKKVEEAPKRIGKSGEIILESGIVLDSKGVKFGDGTEIFELTMSDLVLQEELGHGQYGVVRKAYHTKSGRYLALKEIQVTTDDTTFHQISMELNILRKSNSPYIVKFFGSFFHETKVYYGMEYMDGGSLDKLYDGGVPEPVLAKIAYAMVSGLKYMKEELSIIHRDVKPTNVLVSSAGDVKLCDFGVSGQLVQSLAKTYVGCQHYMAPERINVVSSTEGYGVYSDVWSLGLSLVEVGIGKFPYANFDSVFSQLNAIVNGDTPKLPSDRFSSLAIDFCLKCMIKDYTQRPTYGQLLEHEFLKYSERVKVDMASWVKDGMMHYRATKFGQPLGALTPAASNNYIMTISERTNSSSSVTSQSSVHNTSDSSTHSTPTPVFSDVSSSLYLSTPSQAISNGTQPSITTVGASPSSLTSKKLVTTPSTGVPNEVKNPAALHPPANQQPKSNTNHSNNMSNSHATIDGTGRSRTSPSQSKPEGQSNGALEEEQSSSVYSTSSCVPS